MEWPDGHVSEFAQEWLLRHSYGDKKKTTVSSLARSMENRVLWSGDFARNELKSPVVPFTNVMNTNQGLADWLKNIVCKYLAHWYGFVSHLFDQDKYGFCWVEGVPVTPEATEKLARRISFIRETHYGSFWDFTSNMAHGDTAYTNLAIGGHTDTTYFTDPIGLQLFHLLEHDGKGGETLLVDGFYLAKRLKELYPEHFQTLTKLRIPTHCAGDEGILITPTPRGYPIIQLDPITNEPFQVFI